MKKRVVAVVAVIVLLVGASVASIIYMKSGKNDGSKTGKIKIADASCPDKLCVNMGYISEPLMPITCLPNHLVIRIVNDGEESPSLDGVVY